MTRTAVLLFWRLFAIVCLAIGVVGVFLPVLPTVPFVLVAAWAASRGWPRLESWLLSHTHFGPPIRRWRERGAVPRNAKWFATLSMLGSSAILAFSPLPLAVKIAVPLVMLAVAVWLWRRPDA